MKKALLAIVLALGGCNPGTFQTVSADITNSIQLACGSAQQLLGLPATQAGLAAGVGKIALSAAKLSNKVNLYCTGAQLAAPILANSLNDLNTSAAVLLGTGVANKGS